MWRKNNDWGSSGQQGFLFLSLSLLPPHPLASLNRLENQIKPSELSSQVVTDLVSYYPESTTFFYFPALLCQQR